MRINIAPLHPRPSVRGEEPHPTRGDLVCTEHSGSKGVNLEKTIPNPMVWAPCLWDEWQWVNLPRTAHFGIPGDLPDLLSLTKYGGSAWWTWYFPLTRGISIENTESKSEPMERPLTGDSSKDSKEGSSQGELLCLGAAQGAIKQNPCLLGVSETPTTWEDSDNGQPLQEPGTSGTQTDGEYCKIWTQ